MKIERSASNTQEFWKLQCLLVKIKSGQDGLFGILCEG